MSESVADPLVHVIVITFNGKHHLERCIPTLLMTDYDNYRVLLVDNASEDGSSKYVMDSFPSVRIMRNERNLGFAEGNNVAMRQSVAEGARYVVLLNDDTAILDPNWLRRAVEVAEDDFRTGMVGFDLTVDDSRTPPDEVVISDVERISGCALLIKSDVLQTVGYFDQAYFAYGEESDLEVRAMRAGYRLRQVNIPVYHKGSGSFSKYPMRHAFLYIRNWLRFSIKQEPLWKALLRPFLIFDLLCSPFPIRRREADQALRRKIGTGGRALSFLLLVGAILWNVLHLPHTLLERHRETGRVRLARMMILDGKSS